MDLLSRILTGINARSPLLARTKASVPASIDMLEGAGLPFHYVADGALEIEVADRRYTLGPGDLVILPRAARHLLHFHGGDRPRSILDMVAERRLPLWPSEGALDAPLQIDIGDPPFAASLLSGTFLVDREETAFLLQSMPEILHLSSRESSLQGVADAVWTLVLHEIGSGSAGFSAVASRALELLVVQALRRWLLQSDHPPGWARGFRHDNIRRALQAMYQHPGGDWTVASLARVAGQSRSAFANAFRQTMDETPVGHLRRLRMHLAATRLHHGRASLATLAAELGYANGFALSRAFTSEMGVSGPQYRRRMRMLDREA